MRFLYAKLSGYVGIYNGLGLENIEIDFTRCQNKICVVIGPNGCGKSTLLNALNILPDGNENFVPSLPASKQLRLFDEGVIYDIFINHPLDGKGNRSVTKVSIQKNGIELNPNGNVSSYKDIIFNEFDLDSNFITLTHLSSDDRGLADKKPAERKKFLASITSSLEAYNGIYKNLNKKGNVYKSYINGLTGKINNIGDKTSLRTTFGSLAKRREELNNQIEEIKSKIVQQQTMAAMNDPNGELRNKYLQLEQRINSLESSFNVSKANFDRYCSSNSISEKTVESITAKRSELESLKSEYDKSLELGKANLSIIINDIKNINENIDKDKIRINKLEQEVTPDLTNQLNTTKEKLDLIEKDFGSIGLSDPMELTQDNIQQAIQTVNIFIETLDYIYENLDENKLPEFIDIVKTGENIHSIIGKNTQKIESLKQDLEGINREIKQLSEDMIVVIDLEKRPIKCKIDSCPFLENSTKILKKYNVKTVENCKTLIDSNINKLTTEAKIYDKKIQSYTLYGKDLQEFISHSTYLDKVRTLIEANQSIFNKIGMITPLLDFNAILDRISVGDRFNEFRDIKNLNYISNDIIEYKTLSKVYENLSIEYKANQNNIKALDEYKQELEQLADTLTHKYEERDTQAKDNQFVQSVIEKTRLNIEVLDKALKDLEELNNLSKSLEETKIQYVEIQKQFEGSADSIRVVHELEGQRTKLDMELKPIEEQMRSIEAKLLLLENYEVEYAEYSEKYNMINVLKKHSSPTAGGIQTFFMNLYMGKTLELANQLLGMIFQGQYQLLDYVITPDEFRMPFVGSGLIVDDITSGSTSQVCIMGMIINLSLLNQASTKFNITRLDEIDGGLDYNNRAVFMQILQQVIDILGIEQLFIISHNMESYNGGTDAIQLAPIDGIDNNANGSNVIYHY